MTRVIKYYRNVPVGYERIDKDSVHMYLIENGDVEPVTCKKFGCGKVLSPTHLLYSKYCNNHQPQRIENDVWEDEDI